MLDLPVYVVRCRRRLRDAGHSAYPVGGCVRDLLLGRNPEDWDMATSAHPEQVMAMFARTVPTGLKHGTVTVLLEGGHIEVTTFRREEGYADSRHPDRVSFDAGLTEDLARRDFTINAMALAPDGSVIDPFGGQNDIREKRVRCVGDPEARFREDALRMLRAVRFSAQLGFAIDPAAAAAITSCAPLAARVSAERVRAEVEKTILSPCPEQVGLLFSMGLLSAWLEQPRSCIPDFSMLGGLPPQRLYRWSGLCFLLDGTGLMKRLKPDRHTADVCTAVLDVLHAPPPRTGADWRRLLARCGTQVAEISAAILKREAELENVLSLSPCVQIGRLALTGGDLREMGLRGTEIGAAQRKMLHYVLDHPEANEKESLRRFLQTDAGLRT